MNLIDIRFFAIAQNDNGAFSRLFTNAPILDLKSSMAWPVQLMNILIILMKNDLEVKGKFLAQEVVVWIRPRRIFP